MSFLSVFLCLLLGFLFITGFEQFDYCKYWCHFLHVSCAWISLSLLYLWIYTFQQIQKCFCHDFFKCIFWMPPSFCGLQLRVYSVGLFLITLYHLDSFYCYVFIQLVFGFVFISFCLTLYHWITFNWLTFVSLLSTSYFPVLVYAWSFFYWMSKSWTLTFWLGDIFISMNILEFCAELQWSYLDIFW